MSKYKIGSIRAFIVVIFFFIALHSQAQQTELKYLSGKDASHTEEWEFYCSDGRKSKEWSSVPVPSVWEQQGYGTYNYGHDWKNGPVADEEGLYRHHFTAPVEWKGKIIDIVFDGSMTDTEVKINGKLAGLIHQGAFYRFKYDISGLLIYGKKNLLEVKVSKRSANQSVNEAERQADFWIFGGIFRPVFLEVKPPVNLSRTALDPQADGILKTKIELNEPAGENYTVSFQLFENDVEVSGEIVSELQVGEKEHFLSCSFDSIIAWNPENPHLYEIRLSLKRKNEILHQVREIIGFRSFELREHDGFYLNGRKVVFKGVNRHSFRPETGRCLSDKDHLEDILLMKEMNMNAVRMSHYVPDERFLDLCDSLGLFVLDEVTGWQQGYDTVVGPKLIREAILKDENHPCVVIWDHGNEGGWNFANEKYFHIYDIQKRPVIYPWLLRNGVDTRHYPAYNFATARYANGNAPFMPLEFMHGLYDGGHGAGLEEFWKLYESSPLHAGGFLWAFADEAILRTDMDGQVYDSDGNHAPDGILGPNHEKEASFYTIKEIWSPIQIMPVEINREWDGSLYVQNKYLFSNLCSCSFEWECAKTELWSSKEEIIGRGKIQGPDALPGETRQINIDCMQDILVADIFRLKALDKEGNELYTWTWPVKETKEQILNLNRLENSDSPIRVSEQKEIIEVSAMQYDFVFEKNSGNLLKVIIDDKEIMLSGGAVTTGIDLESNSVNWHLDNEGNFHVRIQNENAIVLWTVYKDSRLRYEADFLSRNNRLKDNNLEEFPGISFNYPEADVRGVKWLGDGPYRVWKNRLKGVEFGIWQKDYNNTITGESYNDLVYPEFKGYHANLYWMELETAGNPIRIKTETPDLYVQWYKPEKPKQIQGGTYPAFPDGDISFLYEIPAIGTKFKKADQMGPSGQKGIHSGHTGDQYVPIILWFGFGE